MTRAAANVFTASKAGIHALRAVFLDPGFRRVTAVGFSSGAGWPKGLDGTRDDEARGGGSAPRTGKTDD
jgi:hypothetical protein